MYTIVHTIIPSTYYISNKTIEIGTKLKVLVVAQFWVLFATNLCWLGPRLDVVADMAKGCPLAEVQVPYAFEQAPPL